jgi:hypothetical protein
MTWWTEWASRPSARKGVMIPVEDLPKLEASSDAGFRSVYEYSDAAAKEIQAAGTSKNFARFEQHSSTLFIDLDNGEKDLLRLRQWIGDSKARADLYTSGSKGYHAHIAIVPMLGSNVPTSQAHFAAGLGIEVDPSLYRPGSLIALPGRLHAKTKKRKTLVESIHGQPIEIPLIEAQPKLDFSKYTESEGTLQQVLQEMYCLASSPPKNGNRYQSLSWLAKLGCKAGITPYAMFNFLQELNKTWMNPKPQDELERAIKDGYHLT